MFACESSFFALFLLLLLALVDCELFFLFFSCFLFCWAFRCYSAFVWLLVFGLGRAVCLTWSCDVVSSKRCSRGPPSVPMLCCCCCSLFVAVVIRVIRVIRVVVVGVVIPKPRNAFPQCSVQTHIGGSANADQESRQHAVCIRVMGRKFT